MEYALHDDAGDLVALLNRANPTGHGHVAWQATYDPYGQPRVAEMPSGVSAGFAYPRIGHKGLFVERLDTTTMLGTERLVSNARLLYHARNRWLQPSLGRWTSRDPNGLGQPVQKSWAMHGVTADVRLAQPDIGLSWTDGANLHQYVLGSPVIGSDEMGLSSYSLGGISVSTTMGASVSTTQTLSIASSSSVVAIGVSGSTSAASVGGVSAMVAALLPGVLVTAPLVALYDSTVSGPNANALDGMPLYGSPITVQAGNVRSVLAYINASGGSAPPGYQGGRTFQNREGRLPQSTTYKEYDILPHTPGVNRGPHRIVVGADGSAWYTKDHYNSFTRVQ